MTNLVSKPYLKYAGIGSRETPPDVLSMMSSIGAQLKNVWLLRSGFADGADKAFGRGAEEAGNFEMFLPWEGFNNAPLDDPRFIVPEWRHELLDIAARSHPAWDRCKDTVKCLHARNVCQVLGKDLNDPVNMVVCWTPGGKAGGGTGQAIRIANQAGIPVFDLALEHKRKELCEFVAYIELMNK